MKKILASILAAVTLAGGMVAAPSAEARNRGFIRQGHGFGGFRGGHSNFGFAGRHDGFAGRGFGGGGRRFGGWGGRRYGGYGGYGRRYGYYGDDGYDDGGDAVAAGVAGLAVGAILGGALSHRNYHTGGSCSARFRSYNPATGTYLGNDGLRHSCP